MKSLSELAATVQNTVLFGTVSGAVGLVATLKSEEDFDFLTRLQKRLAKVITSPGNIEHAEYLFRATMSFLVLLFYCL